MGFADWTQLHSLFSRVMALLTKRDATLQTDIALLRQLSSMRVVRHRSLHWRTVPKTERIGFQKGIPVMLPLFRVPSDLHQRFYLSQSARVPAFQTGNSCWHRLVKILHARVWHTSPVSNRCLLNRGESKPIWLLRALLRTHTLEFISVRAVVALYYKFRNLISINKRVNLVTDGNVQNWRTTQEPSYSLLTTSSSSRLARRH